MFSISPKINEEYYVVFESSLKSRWYSRWLKPGFTHCYVMQKSANGLFWVIINPAWSHCDIDLRTVETFPTPRSYSGDYSLVVKYHAVIDPSKLIAALDFISCVGVVKRIIGIKKFSLVTPYHLYLHLTKKKSL